MPLLSKAASGSVVSSVLMCFFWACNTFMNGPSGFPTDASSAVKKEEIALILKDDGTACISPQLYAPVTQSRSQQTFKCHSERRNIHPILNL
uniref:Secreted protein n=1 Tax=Piliocolobus tephrosceles TaxID=591936 RepID=A0A8C9LID8_9PRIM